MTTKMKTREDRTTSGNYSHLQNRPSLRSCLFNQQLLSSAGKTLGKNAESTENNKDVAWATPKHHHHFTKHNY